MNKWAITFKKLGGIISIYNQCVELNADLLKIDEQKIYNDGLPLRKVSHRKEALKWSLGEM